MARFIGRYEVLAELGRGGFGHVYRCLDPTLGTPVAIKTLTAGGDAGMLVRFRNEAATSRRLTHPHIVTIYDFGDQDGVPYIVMELLDGQDLHQVIETRMPLSLLEKVAIMSQIAAGLGHAHSGGIIHRDVKPANVMLLRDHSVKIMDFGIARITQSTHSRLTPRGAMIGTFRYMAPEQFRGAEPDVRSDIFAYGLVFFELITGVHPFQALEAASQMYSILNAEPVPISELVPACAGALQSVVARLLQKDPDLRYQSLDDVLLDIGPPLLQLREQRAEDLLSQARLEKSRDQLERARALTHEVLGLVPSHHAAREFREQLQTELRRRAIRPRLDDLVKKGQEAMAGGNPSEAAERFESAIRLDPGDTALQNLLRDARAAAEKLREAGRIVAQAENALNSGDHAAADLLAHEALELVPTLTRARQIVEKAGTALAEEKRNARLADQLARAHRLVEAHSWDSASALLAELDRDFPGVSEVHTLAERLEAGRKKEEAERTLAAGLAATREQFRAGNLTGALARIEELSVKFPESAEARSMLDVVRLEMETEQHREFVKRNLEEARALAARHEFEAALRVFDVALSRYPADPQLQRERRAVVLAHQEAARRAAIEKTLARAAEFRAQTRFGEAVKLLEAFLDSQGAETGIQQLRDSIAAEQESARRAEELRNFVRRANELIAKGQLETVTALLGNSPPHVRENSEITRLLDAAEQQRRARNEKQAALDALGSEAQRLCGEGHFDQALHALDNFEGRHGTDPGAGELRRQIREAQQEARAKELCARASALLASDPLQATALLEGAPDHLRARAEVRNLEQAAQRAAAAETEIRWALGRVQELSHTQPDQAVAQLEALARKHPSRADIGDAVEHARDRVRSLKEQSEARRAAEAVQAAAATRERDPKRALKQLQGLSQPIRSRPEIQAAIRECQSAVEALRSAPVAVQKPFAMRAIFAGSVLVAMLGAAVWIFTHLPKPPPVVLIPVEIRTDPEGVAVSIGDRSCRTPNCRLELPPGSYQVGAKLDGYQPAQRSLLLEAGKRPGPVSLTLKPVVIPPPAGRPVGTLVVRTGMPDVLVVIDNKPAGRTDASGTLIWTVEALAHTVRVEKVGFDAPAEKRLTLADKQSLQVAFTLTPQSARLELRGAPAGVEIRMNGTLLGRTGSGAFSAVVPPGAQTLRITEATESREIAQAFEAGRTVILDWSSVAPAVAVTPTPPKIDPAEQAWEALATSTDPAQVQAFIDKYPSGAHAADARSMLEKLVWSRTNQNDAQGLRDYLSRFPAGPHVRESAARLGDLAWNGVDKKDSGSLRAFVDQNPDSAHLGDARSLIDQLQRQAEAERLAQDKAKEQANAQAKAAAAKAAADKAAALRQQQNQAIQSALDQFNAAFEHKSQRELRQIWLRPAQDYLDAINQSGPNSFIATLRPTADAVVANDTATVICELTTLTTFRGQVRPPNRAIMKVTLRNAGGGWQILDLSKP